ncbi:unnamed protein product, partial [Staurois parvus]
WYKAVVNSLVPCDLCDHSQISHVVSNVTSDILLTTLHVITDWPVSDHMIGTSYRGPVQRTVFHCVTDFTRIVCHDLPGSSHNAQWRAPFMNGSPPLHCHRLAIYIQWPDGKWLS